MIPTILRRPLGRVYRGVKAPACCWRARKLFDNNVAHRAVLARATYRDVLMFQVRPATFKTTPYVDRRWTGSFQHNDFALDPSDVRPSVKTLHVFQR